MDFSKYIDISQRYLISADAEPGSDADVQSIVIEITGDDEHSPHDVLEHFMEIITFFDDIKDEVETAVSDARDALERISNVEDAIADRIKSSRSLASIINKWI